MVLRRRFTAAAVLVSSAVSLAQVDCGGSDGEGPPVPVDEGADGGDSGAVADAGVSETFVPIGLVVDFSATSAMFPPTVNKIGFNSFWNSTSNDGDVDTATIKRSAAFRAPMIGALIEPKTLLSVPFDGGAFEDGYEEYARDVTAAELDAEKCALWQQGSGYTNALFYDNAGKVEARTPSDPDLLAIRSVARAAGLINFLQLSGTPGTKLPSSDTYDNGLFTLVGEPTTGGNWYPLPANASFAALAHAFGTFPGAVGATTPTIYAFWQEPSHTISESLNATSSIEKYTNLYWRIANEIATQCARRKVRDSRTADEILGYDDSGLPG